jgi:ferritin
MKKSIYQIIAEYVERNDVGGLAAYFRAYLEDEMMAKTANKLTEDILNKE